ncbi:MAG: hypothetical protein Q9208_005965 [Pyrenodesmia sp. 3 TL-2023]
MKGFDMNEQRGLHGLQFVNAIRKDFTSQLPDNSLVLESAISDEFAKELHNCEIVNGNFRVPLYSMVNRIIARVNCTACFGAELCLESGLQNVIDVFPKDGSISAARIAQECLGVFFFPVIGLTNTTAFALADLSTRSEYLRPLRQELGRWDKSEKNVEGLPLLDSFIKESARLNGTEWGKSPSTAALFSRVFTNTSGPPSKLTSLSLRPP